MTQDMVIGYFQMGRLIDAMSFIGIIIAIWLALRLANMTGENPKSNIVAKLLSTGFGLCVVAGSWLSFTWANNTWINAARNIQELGDNVTNPDRAQAFIDYVGTTTSATTPDPIGMIFLVIVLVMIITLIWLPRNN